MAVSIHYFDRLDNSLDNKPYQRFDQVAKKAILTHFDAHPHGAAVVFTPSQRRGIELTSDDEIVNRWREAVLLLDADLEMEHG